MQETGYWIGVDLHSRVIQACVVDAGGESVFERRHRGASLEEGLELVAELR